MLQQCTCLFISLHYCLLLLLLQSFIHQNHAPDSSWIKGDGFVDRSSSKGSRLIILHAITKFGPLGGRAKLVWKRDTPHPQENDDNVANGGTPYVDSDSAESLTGNHGDAKERDS